VGFGVGFGVGCGGGLICVGWWWVAGWEAGWVAVAGKGGFRWLAVILGVVFFFFLFCFTLLQTHNVKYFLKHFPRVQTNTGKTNIFL
jgi:hypothetical protein